MIKSQITHFTSDSGLAISIMLQNKTGICDIMDTAYVCCTIEEGKKATTVCDMMTYTGADIFRDEIV